MRISSGSACAAALFIVLAFAGCWRRPKAVLRPTPLPPVPAYRIQPSPEFLPEPPEVLLATADIAELPPAEILPPLEIPSRPAPPPRPRPRAGAPTNDPAPPVPAVPKLGQLLSEEQEREYRGELEQALKETAAVLDSVGGKPLTRSQQSLADRARSFARQAEAQRSSDLLTARNLARRANILAQELQRTLR